MDAASEEWTPVNEPEKQFLVRLSRLHRRWQAAGLVVVGIHVLTWCLTVTGVYALLDLALAFSTTERLVLGCGLLATVVALTLVWCTRVLRLTPRDMANRADRIGGNRRMDVLSAYELQRAQHNGDGLADYLIGCTLAEASGILSAMPIGGWLPFDDVRRHLKRCGLVMAILLGLCCLNPNAAVTLARRLVMPWHDVPPYSRLGFQITPEDPKVLYGGGVELAVDISGPPVKGPVLFVTRYRGHTQRVACFQESPGRYAQKLEGIVSPVEFCFEAGRARSHWHQVQVLLQPTITMVGVSITPPTYSQLPRREFFAGSEPISGLRGSKVRLTVTSNRPLKGGQLQIRPLTRPESERVVTGTSMGTNSVEFAWDIQDAATLSVTVRDIQGTANQDPLTLDQELRLDEPPVVKLDEPPAMVMATPEAVVPIRGHAEDDLGLLRVNLIRTVVGYRDRMLPLMTDAQVTQQDVNDELRLSELGVRAGDVLEVYLEALDHNPDMLGAAASDIGRIQIITEEEYATMLRAQIDAQEFLTRFKAVEEDLHTLMEAVRALETAARDPASTEASLTKRLDAVKTANQQESELLQKLIKDTPAFDAEKELATLLQEMKDKVDKNTGDLNAMTATDRTLSAKAAEIRIRMEPEEQAIQKQRQEAEDIAKVAAVMECVPLFSQIVSEQEELTRRLERYGGPVPEKNLDMLRMLGERQTAVHKKLTEFQAQLLERAKALPAAYASLRDSSIVFSETIDVLEIPPIMQKGASDANNQNGPDCYHQAALALEKLQSLLNKPDNDFSGMCKNKVPGFGVSQSVQQTLSQMLQGICQRMMGKGTVGTGGTPGMGDGTGGNSPLNMPVYGPTRGRYAETGGTTGEGKSNGPGSMNAHTDVDASEALPGSRTGEVLGDALPMERIPEQYRDAVKRYFSETNP